LKDLNQLKCDQIRGTILRVFNDDIENCVSIFKEILKNNENIIVDLKGKMLKMETQCREVSESECYRLGYWIFNTNLNYIKKNNVWVTKNNQNMVKEKAGNVFAILVLEAHKLENSWE
jgi:hypothetical protein